MADFKLAYPKTERFEGGYAMVPGDLGGETYAGITRKNFPKWEGWDIVDAAKPLKWNQRIKNNLLDDLVEKFYKKVFWDVVDGDDITDQLTAERLFDFGVNAGQGRSIKEIQEVLGIPQTGKLDAITLDAINNPAKYLIK